MPISDQLDDLIKGSKATHVGLAAHHLATGEELLIQPDLAFHAASTMKICVMMEVYRRRRMGEFSLDDPMLIYNEFPGLLDGTPYSLFAADDSETDLYNCIGQRLPVRELVRRMIVRSSNLASNVLIERVTPRRVTQFMQQLGGESLIVLRGLEDKQAYQAGVNNEATARGFMHILVKLARREVVSAEDSDEMITILSQQEFNEMIPAQLPPGVRVAHKTGWTGDYYHDVGIVYPPDREPFVLAILTKGYAESEPEKAHAFVASLAQEVYEHWVK